MDQDDSELDDRLAPPRAPLRAMQILAQLATKPEGATLAWLSEQLQLPKTSLFSLLRSLEAGNYITSDNGHHRLSQESYSLAAAISQHDSLASRLRPYLQQLQHDCEETVMLAVPSADWSRLIIADVIEAASSLRVTARVGAERPLYSTAIGLALLSFATPEQQNRYIEHTELIRFTPDTITSATALRKALQQIRKNGYVINSGSVLGLTAIAVPIFGLKGTIVATVNLAGPSTRIEERSSAFLKLVLKTGRQMSQMLGHTKPYPKAASDLK